MFCREKQRVAARALMSPRLSKDISVAVASSTPPMMGMRETYTWKEEEEGGKRKQRVWHMVHHVAEGLPKLYFNQLLHRLTLVAKLLTLALPEFTESYSVLFLLLLFFYFN